MKADMIATTAITTAIMPINSGEKSPLLLVVTGGAYVAVGPVEVCISLGVGVGVGVAVGVGVGCEPA
jgi:hypothetical protein